MTFVYLDIETEGINPERDKIVTIQYQFLNSELSPTSKLIILKSYESSEEEIIKKFFEEFQINSTWGFIPLGYNLIFDITFIIKKFIKYGLMKKENEIIDFLFKKPYLDVKPLFIFINNNSFKGSGLDVLTNKKHSGNYALEMYSKKEYKLLEEYITQETESFLEAIRKVFNKINQLNLKDE